jgi:hypothetical protein
MQEIEFAKRADAFNLHPIPHVHPKAASDPPKHHAVNHQHPVLLPEVPVLAAQF